MGFFFFQIFRDGRNYHSHDDGVALQDRGKRRTPVRYRNFRGKEGQDSRNETRPYTEVCVLSLIIFGLRKALTWYSQVPYGFRWFLRRGTELDSDCEGGDHSNVPAVHHPVYITVNQHFRMYAAEEPRYTKG